MLNTIISGGQTGADQAGLEVGYQHKMMTGGFAPRGWKTKTGPNPELLRNKFHLREHQSKGYKERTWANVEHSHGTIRCCVDFWSAGEICTLKAIRHYRKPMFDIYILSPPPVEHFLNWIHTNNIQILNVAGNTNGTRGYDIYSPTFEYLNFAIGQYLTMMKQVNIDINQSKKL